MNRLFRIILFLLMLGVVCPTVEAQKSKTRTTSVRKSKTGSAAKKQRRKTRKASQPVVTSKDVNNLKSKRDALQKKVKQSQAQLARTNRDVKKQLHNLNYLNGEIDRHEKNIGTIKGQLDSVNHNIAKLEETLRELMAQLKDCKLKYSRSMLYMYQNRKASNKMLFMLSSADFAQMARRYMYVKEYSKYQRVQGEIVQRKQIDVERAKEQLTQERNRHTQLLTNEEEENRQLVARKAEQQTAVDKLQKKQKALQRVIASEQKEIAALNSKIEYYVQLAIEQERKRREEAERKRREAAERQAREQAERQRRENDKTARSGKSSKGKSSNRASATSTPEPKYSPNDKEYKLTSNFASNRGRLPMPITGSYVISTRYGSYTMPGMKVRLESKGINLTGTGGAQARCIFDGEVTAIFNAGGMKNVMVRHGSYISVYCNLVSVSVRQGQRVSARQTLGSVAADASGKPNLHFQLRKEAATLNPELWLAR